MCESFQHYHIRVTYLIILNNEPGDKVYAVKIASSVR